MKNSVKKEEEEKKNYKRVKTDECLLFKSLQTNKEKKFGKEFIEINGKSENLLDSERSLNAVNEAKTQKNVNFEVNEKDSMPKLNLNSVNNEKEIRKKSAPNSFFNESRITNLKIPKISEFNNYNIENHINSINLKNVSSSAQPTKNDLKKNLKYNSLFTLDSLVEEMKLYSHTPNPFIKNIRNSDLGAHFLKFNKNE